MAGRISNIGLVRRPLGTNEEFIYSELTNSSAVLPKAFANVLGMCAEWATPHDHAVRSAGTRASIDDIQSLLASFAAQKLVVSEETVLTGLKSSVHLPSGGDAHIGSLVIVTRNRPETLLRCIQSYADNFRVYKRAIDILVFDDSGEATTRDRTCTALATLTLPRRVNLFYYGPEQMADFAQRLAVLANCKLDTVRFGILRDPAVSFAVGASRNAALLTTCGQMFVTVDDDTVADCGDAPDLRRGLHLSSTSDPTQWWFAPDRNEAMRLAPTLDADIIGLYEQLLGRTVTSLIAREDDLHLDFINASFVKGVVESNASVAACAMGLKGDCALNVPALYFSLEGPSYERLVRSNSAYENAFISREVIRSAPQLTISNTATYITNNVGIDNRRLLPPFLPKYYGEDILFGLLLNICRSDSYSAHLPSALLHDADPSRTFHTVRATDCEPVMLAGQLLALMIERFAPHLHSRAPEQNLVTLGRYFRMLGAESPEQFHHFILHEWKNQTVRSIALLKLRIARLLPSAPVYYLDDLRRLLKTMTDALLKSSPMPLDMTSNKDAAGAWLLFQDLLASYGRLLEAWPKLVQSAAALNASPHVCAVKIRTAPDLQA